MPRRPEKDLFESRLRAIRQEIRRATFLMEVGLADDAIALLRELVKFTGPWPFDGTEKPTLPLLPMSNGRPIRLTARSASLRNKVRADAAT